MLLCTSIEIIHPLKTKTELYCLYRRTVHFEGLFKQHTNKCTYIVFNNLKFALKHLKRSYLFRSYDHP